MAYQTKRTLAELKKECNQLNIKVNKEGRIYKNDYIDKLREYYIDKKYNGDPPVTLKKMIDKIECPMLCQRYSVLKDKEKDKIWKSKKWYLEEKMDGVRMIIFYIDGEINFFSRGLSVEDHLPISYKDNIYMGDIDLSKIKDSFVLDSEVVSINDKVNTIMEKRGVVTETQLQAVSALLAMEDYKSIEIQKELNSPLKFYTFDCLYWNGEWLLNKPLVDRRKFLREGLDQMDKAGFKVSLPPSNISNKKAFYRSIIYDGKEGVVAKNINYPYIPTSSRRRDGWVKIKRTMSESLQMEGIGDTIDGWISGYEVADPDKDWSGLIGALEVSVFLEDEEGNRKVHPIAKISGISMELREEMTELDDEGDPKLKQDYYGKVLEVDGQSISARSKRLRHAVLVRWREDKRPDQCVIDKEFLESMIL